MNVLGSMAACLSHDDVTPFIVPFQNRTGTDAQFLANLRRNRDLTLRGELGMSQSHAAYITTVMVLRRVARAVQLLTQVMDSLSANG